MYLDLLVRWLEKNDEDIPERVVFHGDITMVESVKTPPTETKQTKVMIVMFGWEGSPIRKKNTKSEKYMENTQRQIFSLNKQTGWWFQPIWKILVKMEIISPRIGVKLKNIWENELDFEAPNHLQSRVGRHS